MPLDEFCERYLWIQDKNDRVVPFRLNKIQKHFADNMTGRDIVLKSRQVGLSTVIAAYQFKRTIERSSRSVSIAHDDKTTQKLRRMALIFYERLPDSLGISRTQDNASITSYSNKSEVTIITAGSPQSGRGGTYGGVFHASEIAFWQNASGVLAGAMQGVPPGGIVVLESTPNGSQGLFYDEVQKSKNGESEYTLHFYPWFWDSDCWLELDPEETITYTKDEQALVDKHGLTSEQIKWRRKKIAEPGMADLFPQEYPEDSDTCFLTSGDSAFPNVHLAMQKQPQDKPIPGHVYVSALDWGQDNDYSAHSVFDATNKCEVSLNRWRRETYRAIREHVIDECLFWGVRRIMPEGNSMSTNVEDLIDDMRARGCKTSVMPFMMSNPAKHELVSQFKTGYQELGMKLLDTDYGKQEMNIFVKKQTPTMLWTYAAEGDGHDDTVIARLLAWNMVIGGNELTFGDMPAALSDYLGSYGTG